MYVEAEQRRNNVPKTLKQKLTSTAETGSRSSLKGCCCQSVISWLTCLNHHPTAPGTIHQPLHHSRHTRPPEVAISACLFEWEEEQGTGGNREREEDSGQQEDTLTWLMKGA